MYKPSIKATSAYLPKRKVLNNEIEEQISFPGYDPQTYSLARLFGSQSRYHAADHEQVSDLACRAALPILDEYGKEDIDLLIFAAASSDLIEPATANIIQSKLNLNCPVFDVKNACNSVITAIQIASAYIDAGIYKNILIVNGEKLSMVINYNPVSKEHLIRCMSGYTLGDAGSAILMGRDGHHIIAQRFISIGEYWDLCTVKGGGSLAYKDAGKYYFECDSAELKSAFSSHILPAIEETLSEAKWSKSDLKCIVPHQVTAFTCAQLARHLDLPEHIFKNTFPFYGNTAAATIPLALDDVAKEDLLKKGDKLMILGLAAGISVSVQLIEW